MQYDIATIKVSGRHRKDVGDIDALCGSINEIGLLHPIVIKPDGTLIAGERRLAAYKKLGHDAIPVTIAETFDDLYRALRAERDENTCREPFKPSEAIAIGKLLEPFERDAAKARQGERTDKHPENFTGSAGGNAADKTAAAVGMSRPTYTKAKAVVDAAEHEPNMFGDLVDQMDKTDSVDRAYHEMKRRQKDTEQERERIELEEQRAQEAADAQAHRAHFTPRIICGDVTDSLRDIPSSSVDLIATDPPYNMGKAAWDELGDFETYAAWCKGWLQECRRVLKPTGAIYVFGRWDMLRYVSIVMDELELLSQDFITWDTIQGSGGGLWTNRQEHILYYSKTEQVFEDDNAVKVERHEAHIREYKGREYKFKHISNVWRIPCVDDKDAERTSHPTQKPVEIMERIIRASCPRDGIVLDCFMGSGTTGVAAIRTERQCIGIERDQSYIDIAVGRFVRAEIGASL